MIFDFMNTNLREKDRDERLKIKTVGRDDTFSDEYRFPYEPTPSSVLERLCDSGLIGESDVVLDYGCGKGRVGFYLSYSRGVKTIGVEYDARIYQDALENKGSCVSGVNADFILANAENYEVSVEVNRCYFFNPFSVEILRRAMSRIIDSYYSAPREILLFFYYPSDEYMGYLMTLDELEFYDEIDCGDLFDGNDKRERILVFSLPYYGKDQL